MRPSIATSLVAVPLFLASCATTSQEAAVSGGEILTVISDGKTFTYRHVEAEPLTYLDYLPEPVNLPPSPGLRIRGPVDHVEANRAMAVICGHDPDGAETYGDYGDPMRFDDSTGEWVYWMDCR